MTKILNDRLRREFVDEATKIIASEIGDTLAADSCGDPTVDATISLRAQHVAEHLASTLFV